MAVYREASLHESYASPSVKRVLRDVDERRTSVLQVTRFMSTSNKNFGLVAELCEEQDGQWPPAFASRLSCAPK